MVSSIILASVFDVPSSGEIIFELVKRTGHNPVCQVESLLNSVSMMNININVKYSLIGFEKFENPQHTVVNIAKS